MPRRAAAAAAAAARPKIPARRQSRRTAPSARPARKNDNVPNEFRELLAEAEAAGDQGGQETGEPSRPLKRRRVGDRPTFEESIRPEILPSDLDTASELENDNSFPTDRAQQTVTRDSSSDSDSDIEFEDVDIGSDGGGLRPAEPEDPKDVSITLQEKPEPTPRRMGKTKRVVTAAEKQMRLAIHKVYLCCLLHHSFVRNSYCNDHVAQKTLRGLLNGKTRSMLVPKREHSQARQTALFMDGLNAVNELWKLRWKVTHIGLRRPHWASSADDIRHFRLSEQIELSLDREEFRRAADKLRGSVDLGAQALCALLRSAGVTARLACSLQPLPFNASSTSATPRKDVPAKKTVYADASDGDNTASDATVATDASKETTARPSVARESPVMPRRIVRIGQSRTNVGTVPDMGKAPTIVAPETRSISRPNYPVYWVEAFDKARQKWIAIDPLVTQTVGKPSRLEPPLNDAVNAMTYVVAFEEDGSAKDVTRRYTRAYNAKTRRMRVESTEGGERWLRKALKLFRRRDALDRDSIEDAELARKEASEGMPRNVQDFKNHPYYVLERHLRHNEIIHPMTEVGKVNSGGAAAGRLESVYRRKDVHVVRSGDKWYRFGREVKAGEQPLKHGKPRKQRRGIYEEQDQDQDEDDVGVALYAVFQTELYVAPPVVRGKVPRNAFGNLDIYVPSMVPMGGVHVRSRDAAKAARALKVDYAEAVTGFKFQGRQGTAVVDGIVIAEENHEDVLEKIAGFEQARVDAAAHKRSIEMLRLWRRFMLGLRVVERMQDYKKDDGDDDEHDIRDEIDRAEDKDEQLDEGGGFFVDPDDDAAAEPTTNMHVGAIAEDFPYQDLESAEPAVEQQLQSFLPNGTELVGFEGVELKPIARPAKRLLALEDSDDEEGQEHQRQPVAASSSKARANPSVKPHASSALTDQASHLPHDDGGGGFMLDDEPSPAAGEHMLPDVDGTNERDLKPAAIPTNVHKAAEARYEQVKESDFPDASGSLNEQHASMEIDEGGRFISEREDDAVERGSLLSHDPDDEDAEPEWLED